MPDTTVIWTPDKTLSPAERALLLRILFGRQKLEHRNAVVPDAASDEPSTVGVKTSAPAAAGTAPGLAD
ncbi:hypothetical protein ACWGI9_40095 [Streptomyces sp. NPDC054833]